MTKNKKIAHSGLRVLKLLKRLSKEPLSTDELLIVIGEATGNVYRKEVVNKYLNTLKILGFEINKINGKYYLEKGLEKIDFDASDLSIMMFLEKYVNSLRLETFKDTIFEALQIAEKAFSENTKEIVKSKEVKIYKPKKQVVIKDENIKMFEKYCKEHLRIELTYKADNASETITYKIAPMNVLYKKGKALLIGHDYKLSEYKEFVIENIIASKQTPQKSTQNFPSAVTFKLKDRLAKAYKLKHEEKAIEYGDDYVIISNEKEDRDLLVKRLLRYYENCEILYPKSCRQKLVELIEEMEKIHA